MSIQCIPLTKIGGRVCNGVLHEIESVMKPVTDTLWEFIENNEQLKTLRKVLEVCYLLKNVSSFFFLINYSKLNKIVVNYIYEFQFISLQCNSGSALF